MRDDRPSAAAGASGGIGFTGALTLLLIGLKLTGVIDWPWIWVLSPIWLSAIAVILIVALVVAAAMIQTLRDDRRRRREKGTR